MMPTLFPIHPQTALALSIFLTAFAYEDGATLLAAALSVAGQLDTRLGLASAFLGIWLGDMGLYFLGASLGRLSVRSPWLQRIATPEKLAKAEAWFSKRGPVALAISRFIPGSRLPLYVAAGVVRVPARLFAAITAACGAFWVSGIFLVWHYIPRSSFGAEGGLARWLLAAIVLSAPLLLGKGALKLFHRLRTLYQKYRRWEFWPGWLFYPPVAAMCVWLGIRYRGFSLPTAANPAFRNGGMVGESKIEALQALMDSATNLVADTYLIRAGELPQRLSRMKEVCAEYSLGYPFVLKPNVGQRGAGFKLISSAAQAEQHLSAVPADLVLQRYIPDPKEVGIFYYRFPGWTQGKIFAVTEKIFPAVVGDGTRTFEELLKHDPRARLIAKTYVNRFPELCGRVIPANQRLRLVEAGNHCQGCIFRDGRHLNSPALQERIDEISRSLPGFFIGRYDVRYASDDDLRRGEKFRIIELNGAASEATNIYDEQNSLLSAYRTLYRQWALVYAIGSANREHGHLPAPLRRVWSDWRAYQAMSAGYPAAD